MGKNGFHRFLDDVVLLGDPLGLLFLRASQNEVLTNLNKTWKRGVTFVKVLLTRNYF